MWLGLELFRGGPVVEGHVLSPKRMEAGTIVALVIEELVYFWLLFADFRLNRLVALYFERNKKKKTQYAEKMYKSSHFPGSPEKYKTSRLLFLSLICYTLPLIKKELAFSNIYVANTEHSFLSTVLHLSRLSAMNEERIEYLTKI